MSEPRYVKIYCATACEREVSTARMGQEWTKRTQRRTGLTLAEKVDGTWRCRNCGKPVSVVW